MKELDTVLEQYRQQIQSLLDGQLEEPFEPLGEDAAEDLGRAIEALRAHLLRVHKERLATVRVTENILAGHSLDDVLETIYETFSALIPYDRIGFATIDETSQTVRSHWVRSNGEIKLGLGYAAPLEGSTLKELMHSGQVRVLNDLEQYLAQKPESESTRLIVEEGMRSGLTCPVRVSDHPMGFLFFSSRQPGAYRDVHVYSYERLARRVAMVLEKSRLFQDLVEANQQKNQFLGVVSHDLRSPLSVIMGFLGLLQKGKLGELTPAQIECLQRMDHSCRSMIHLIDGLLDISAIESGRLELEVVDVDFRQFLREWFESARILAQSKSIELALEMPDALPGARIDPQRLEQALNNLATNAVKFSPPDSQVGIFCENRGDQIVVSIRDHGPGIPAEELDRIFHAFGRTSVRPTSGEKSTGLGLAIARRLIEAHDGHIWVESRQGEGSTFAFSLPALTHHRPADGARAE